MCTAAIVAGGRAVRLDGQDKGALRIGAEPIVARQLAVLRQVTSELLIIDSAPNRYAGYGVRVVPDAVPEGGPLGGVYTALGEAPVDPVLIVACDMPFLRADLLAYLVGALPGYDVAIPRSADGFQPLCAVYAKACAAPIRARLDRRALSLQGLLADLRVREIGDRELARFDPGRAFLNINTPEDYERARKIVP